MKKLLIVLASVFILSGLCFADEKLTEGQKLVLRIEQVQNTRDYVKEQMGKLEGVEFDKEELKIRRQELVNSFATKIKEDNKPGKAGYNERGMKSNNQ